MNLALPLRLERLPLDDTNQQYNTVGGYVGHAKHDDKVI
jgi:hypothetical protein